MLLYFQNPKYFWEMTPQERAEALLSRQQEEDERQKEWERRRQAYLQESFSSAYLCTAIAMIAYVLTNFLFGLFLGLTPLARIFGFLLTAVLTLLTVPVLYPVLKAIGAFGGYQWKE